MTLPTSRNGRCGARRTRTIAVQKARATEAQINVTPLIDVVLVVLITFMVMTPLMEKGLTVQLATEKRAHEPTEAPLTQILVAVDGKQSLQVNAQSVDRDHYLEHLRKLLRGRSPSDRVVFVVASDDASYASLVEAVDRARQAGAITVGFAPGAPL